MANIEGTVRNGKYKTFCEGCHPNQSLHRRRDSHSHFLHLLESGGGEWFKYGLNCRVYLTKMDFWGWRREVWGGRNLGKAWCAGTGVPKKPRFIENVWDFPLALWSWNCENQSPAAEKRALQCYHLEETNHCLSDSIWIRYSRY